MEKHIDIRAFAKINLTLDVLGKMKNGYHEMRMVMQAVDLYDDISITVKEGKDLTVTTDRPHLPAGIHNLAGMAAKEFLHANGIENMSVHIHIKKRIPDKAGLAGGSADAAAVIRGLNTLLGTNLRPMTMEIISTPIGSDVAFCLSGGTALATGRGDRLMDLAPMPDCYIALCKPDFSVSTPELFGKIDARDIRTRPDTEGMLSAIAAGDLRGIAFRCRNVFEEVLPPAERETVERIKSTLLTHGALGAAMTGTGSVVFGIFETQEAARAAIQRSLGEWFITRPLKKVL